MKLLNSSSLMGGLRRFVYYGMVGERDCLFMGAEMVSSIVMYNLGVGPWGTL
jgi:hypothetical protein